MLVLDPMAATSIYFDYWSICYSPVTLRKWRWNERGNSWVRQRAWGQWGMAGPAGQGGWMGEHCVSWLEVGGRLQTGEQTDEWSCSGWNSDPAMSGWRTGEDTLLMEGRCAGWAGEVNEPQSGQSCGVPPQTDRKTGEVNRGNTRAITRGTVVAVTDE